MAVTIEDLGEGIALVTMAGKSATQSFSMEFCQRSLKRYNLLYQIHLLRL